MTPLMKTSSCFPTLCAVTVAVILLSGGLLRGESLIDPVDPSVLLKALPAVPPGWKCVQSTGRTFASIQAMPTTEVIRRYEIPGKDKKPPGLLKIAATDSGSLDYSEGSDSSPTSPGSLNINGLQGNLMVFGARIIFGANVGKRLSVDVETTNIEKDDFQEILQKLDFSTFAGLEKNLPVKLLPPDRTYMETIDKKLVPYAFWNFHGVHVDELDPSDNGPFTTPIVRPLK